jgi:hypothetical protein
MMSPLVARAGAQRLARLCAATGHQLGQANTLRSLGELEFLLGNNRAPRVRYAEALRLYEALSEPAGLWLAGATGTSRRPPGCRLPPLEGRSPVGPTAQRSGSPRTIAWMESLRINC